jgi:hypothetical protein
MKQDHRRQGYYQYTLFLLEGEKKKLQYRAHVGCGGTVTLQDSKFFEFAKDYD